MSFKIKCWALLLIAFTVINSYGYAQNKPATISVNLDKLDKEVGEMLPIWAWFGYDEPNYTYMKDGKKMLTEIAGLSPVPVFVRAHNLLTSGDGTPALKWDSTNVYTEDDKGDPVPIVNY